VKRPWVLAELAATGCAGSLRTQQGTQQGTQQVKTAANYRAYQTFDKLSAERLRELVSEAAKADARPVPSPILEQHGIVMFEMPKDASSATGKMEKTLAGLMPVPVLDFNGFARFRAVIFWCGSTIV
jgi:hypothetical protein